MIIIPTNNETEINNVGNSMILLKMIMITISSSPVIKKIFPIKSILFRFFQSPN